MSNVATLRSTSGSGFIRALKADEQQLLHEHLLRLDPTSRRDRFNGGIGDDFLKTYAERCFDNGTVVIAYLQDGVVRGAAELHAPQHSDDDVPEAAFSVEDRVRRQGVGSALFEQLLAEAGRAGYRRLRITTGGQNQAMKALAVKFGAHLSFYSGEATGIIDLTRSKAASDMAETTEAAAAAPRIPAPALAPWMLPSPTATAVREFMRGSQEMWSLVFQFYGQLFTARHRLGTR